MKPHNLHPKPGAIKLRKRVGRGEGSGRGKTAGRGTKGTRARGEVHMYFEGGQMPITRRIPKLKGFTPPNKTVYGGVNVGALSVLEGSTIGPDQLRSAGLVHKRDKLIKILGGGEIDRAVTVSAHAFSGTARSKIEAAGGSVEVLPGAKTKKKKRG
jgi:large subunit ribosomal protein L15